MANIPRRTFSNVFSWQAFCICIQNSLNVVPGGLTDDRSALNREMARLRKNYMSTISHSINTTFINAF